MSAWHNGTRKGLESLGFIVNNKATPTGYMGLLKNMTDARIDKDELREYVNRKLDEDEGLFFEYEESKAKLSEYFDEEKTCAKLVETPYKEKYSGKPIYAYFTKMFGRRGRWSGCFFGTEEKIERWINENIISVARLPMIDENGAAKPNCEPTNYKFQGKELLRLASKPGEISKRAFELSIQQSIDEGDVTYWAYDRFDPKKHSEFSQTKPNNFDPKTTFAIMIETAYVDKEKRPIWAYFTRKTADSSTWGGITFASEDAMRNWFTTHYTGEHVRFVNHKAADKFVTELHDTLLPGETWSYKESEQRLYPRVKYQILESYIGQIFNKLYADVVNPYDNRNKGKFLYNRAKKYALFNTGLLTRFAKEIYIICEVCPGAHDEPFSEVTSLKIMCGYNQELLAALNFDTDGLRNDMPGMVDFIGDLKAGGGILYDSNLKVEFSEDKWNHIIQDNKDRFPESYRKFIERGNLQKVADELEKEVRNAEKFAARNYAYVVPQYRHKNRSAIQFLMPIYLDGDYEREPDFALVLNREADYYKPETILDLSLAYNNARVISQPRNTWLAPENMTEAIEQEDE